MEKVGGHITITKPSTMFLKRWLQFTSHWIWTTWLEIVSRKRQGTLPFPYSEQICPPEKPWFLNSATDLQRTPHSAAQLMRDTGQHRGLAEPQLKEAASHRVQQSWGTRRAVLKPLGMRACLVKDGLQKHFPYWKKKKTKPTGGS